MIIVLLGFNVIFDPIVGYFYRQYLLGIPQEAAKIIATWVAGATAFNAVICVFISVNAKQINSKDIAPYVFPNNLVKSIGDMHFMPDGTSYLSLSSNKKMIVQYATESGLPIDTILNTAKTREYTIDKVPSEVPV